MARKPANLLSISPLLAAMLFACFAVPERLAAATPSTVAAPTFSPAPGTFTNSVTVMATTKTPDSTIRYTVNGNDPTAASPVFPAAGLALTATTRLKARAYKTGLANSAVTAGNYIVVFRVATPALTPAPGTYNHPITVKASTATAGARIRYTTNGADPTGSSRLFPNAGLVLTSTTTLKARAFANQMIPSPVTAATYTLVLQAAAPIFAPPPGRFTNSVKVSASTPTSGAAIRYTTNGIDPTSASTLFPVSGLGLNTTTTLKARAFKSGMTDSPVTTGDYTIVLQLAPPVFRPAPGTYNNSVTVVATASAAGVTVRYTTSGNDPTPSAPVFPAAGLALTTTTTLKARAFKNGINPSAVTTGTYTIIPRVATPALTPPHGVFTNSVTVKAATATTGATIRYTTDGSEPSKTSTLFPASGLVLTKTTLLRVRAFMSGMNNSAIAGGIYSVLLQVAAPTFSPAPGNYSGAVTVKAVTTTSGATIRYSTTAANPTRFSPVFPANGLSLTATTTLKASAFRVGMVDSPVTTGTYTITRRAGGLATILPGPGALLTPPNTASVSSQTGLSPMLAIHRAGDHLLLAWPAALGPDFLLQTRSETENWTSLNLPIALQGDQNTVTILIESKARFFRLAK